MGEMTQAVVRREFPVPVCPADAPRALPISVKDEFWEVVYVRSYRRLCRNQKPGIKWPHPASHRAALLADYAVWQMVPPLERPEGWPRTLRELANSVGCTALALKSMAASVRLHEIVERSGPGLESRIREMDRKLYDRADVELTLTEPGKTATKAAELWYKRVGALQSGTKTEVNINHGTQVMVQGDAEKWLERARRLAAYLPKEVRDGGEVIEARSGGEVDGGGGEEDGRGP